MRLLFYWLVDVANGPSTHPNLHRSVLTYPVMLAY